MVGFGKRGVGSLRCSGVFDHPDLPHHAPQPASGRKERQQSHGENTSQLAAVPRVDAGSVNAERAEAMASARMDAGGAVAKCERVASPRMNAR